MSEGLPGIVISDANVLIDYCLTNRTILRLVTKHLWAIRVPRPIVDEVEQLNDQTARSLGLVIVDPDIEDLAESVHRSGRLSREDKLCFVMARRHGWACWTNDTGLRRICDEEGIAVHWGMEAMILLHHSGRLLRAEAVRTATAIHKINGQHVTRQILDRFIAKLEGNPHDV